MLDMYVQSEDMVELLIFREVHSIEKQSNNTKAGVLQFYQRWVVNTMRRWCFDML